ncbi:glutamate--tRNA ligase [Rhodobacterales bacterium HKCCE4037]|nr:glutamate--tRNA ligase [Rhodobacterales bacterium HKCCE4037]
MSNETQIVTRIAPSPTGMMHIGTARTGLFNWLFARANGGRFLLRIEDTDRERSTPEATQAILDGMAWLGLDYDGEAVSQFERAPRHRDVAEQMLANGSAYKCFSTQEEIAAFREAAREKGESTLFLSPWRDVPEAEHPDAPYVIRLKAPREGTTVIADKVQGDVTIQNATLDDMILLRSDGTPTYMHAVVVDDHDMGVTHVIRGDDHLNNAARQIQVYRANDWDEPVWAHIPLIHGEDGKKLSKRHGATGVMEYAEMGIPAAAMRNYLARLGWSHGDDELFTDEQAREWFDLKGIGKSPARLDMKKLANVTGWHIAQSDDGELVEQIGFYLALTNQPPLSQAQKDGLLAAMYCLKDRAKNLPDILDKARFVLEKRPLERDEKAEASLDAVSRGILLELTAQLQNASWSRDTLEGVLNATADSHGLKFGKLAGPLRAALSGRMVSPSVFDMMLVLGRDETLARLTDAASPNT